MTQINENMQLNNLTATFKSELIERDFRNMVLAEQKRQYYIVAVIGMLAWVSFIFSDFATQKGLILNLHLVVRFTFILLTLVIAVYMRGAKNPFIIDKVMFGWIMIGFSFAMWITYWRPHSGFSYILVHSLMLYCLYVAIPMTVPSKLVTGFYGSVVFLYIIFIPPVSYTVVEVIAIFLSFAFYNALGVAMVYRTEIDRRRIFRMVEIEKALRLNLEKTMAEVRVLQGLLPICAWCKRIKQPDSSWKSIEDYVTEYSDATFSHGVCPDCAKRLLDQQK